MGELVNHAATIATAWVCLSLIIELNALLIVRLA